MIAQSNEYMAEAANSIFRMNADDMMRKRCLDREKYYRDIRGWKKQIEEQGVALEEKDAKIEELGAALEEKDAVLQEKDAEIARLRKQLDLNTQQS